MTDKEEEIIFDVDELAYREIEDASSTIHETLVKVTKKTITEAQAFILIAGANKKIEASLNFMGRKGNGSGDQNG